jgi:serine/threonine-protein kinase
MGKATRLPAEFGDYRLVRVLGEGAITTAYLATHEGRGERVLLKQIHPDLIEANEELDLFLSEAQVLAALDHPNIGRILDVGMVGPVPYLALEFLSGRDLSEVLRVREGREKRPLPLPICVYVARVVAEALAHAHGRVDESGRSLRIVHRDISPNNVILCFDGTVKLIDFGIARSVLRSTRTAVGMIRGTPGYMAPEQIRGGGVDARADVFTLGTLLYRMVAGRPAFPVEPGDFESYRRPITDEVTPLHLIREQVPEALSLLVAEAMRKDVAERLPSAARMAEGLEAIARAEGYTAGPAQVADLLAWLFPEAAEISGEDEVGGPDEREHDLAQSEALSYLQGEGAVLPEFDGEQTIREPPPDLRGLTDPTQTPARTDDEIVFVPDRPPPTDIDPVRPELTDPGMPEVTDPGTPEITDPARAPGDATLSVDLPRPEAPTIDAPRPTSPHPMTDPVAPAATPSAGPTSPAPRPMPRGPIRPRPAVQVARREMDPPRRPAWFLPVLVAATLAAALWLFS